MKFFPLLSGLALSSLLLAPASAAALKANVLPAAGSVDFLVHLPLRNSNELDQLIENQSSKASPLYHHFLSPAQFRASFGPAPATVSAAIVALQRRGFTITKTETQLLHVRGTSTAIHSAFGVQLGVMQDAVGARYQAMSGAFAVPSELKVLGATVAGIAPTARPRPALARSSMKPPANRYAQAGIYWFDDLKQAYDYPAYGTANGKGITVATVGASDFSDADAAAYFGNERLGKGGLAPAPLIEHAILPGASPFDPSTGISDEADLDVQQVGGSAPGATVVGVSVNGPGEPFLEAYSYLDEANYADIVSTSYGGCELDFTAAYNGGVDFTGILLAYHDLFRAGNVLGITFIFSSGDESGTSCYPIAYYGPGTGKTYKPLNERATFWSSDPNVTGVGGTNLITTSVKGSLQSKYVRENEIGDTITTPVDFAGTGNFIVDQLWGSGNGYSAIFAKPTYQKAISGVPYPTRTVPDVSMHMGGCPFYGPGIHVGCDQVNRDSADIAVVGGQLVGLIGTSASAPEFAGLLAVKESVIGSRMGNENYDLYDLAAANASGKYFRQGQPTYNGSFRTSGALGYSRVIGVGTPIARNFIGLPFAGLAGNPQTSTNP